MMMRVVIEIEIKDIKLRYLSLLLTSYQESEMLSLSRLARMSGSRSISVVVVVLVVSY